MSRVCPSVCVCVCIQTVYNELNVHRVLAGFVLSYTRERPGVLGATDTHSRRCHLATSIEHTDCHTFAKSQTL